MSFRDLSNDLFDSCLMTFGEIIQYIPREGEPLNILGVFTKEYRLIKEGDFDSAVSSYAPAVEIGVTDLIRTPTAGEKISARGEQYKIVEVQPNNEGQIKLILKGSKK